MGRPRAAVIAFAVLLAGAASVNAQSGAGAAGGAVRRGFSSPVLIAQLSLYLPEEATRGMYRAPGGQGGGGAGGAAGGAGAGARAFPRVSFPRDPALFLTSAQIAKLLPILQELREAPLPTPAKAREVTARVDAVLTAAQKAEWARFEEKMAAMFQEMRARGSGSGAPAAGADGGGPGAPGGAPAGSVVERRQRQLDAFIQVLRARLKQ